MRMWASEIVKALQELIKKHGDQKVISGGEDYPGEVSSVVVIERGDGYMPKGQFAIHSRL